ncbi:MAG: flagellar basal body rod protein FlgC [bacterium]
MGILNALDISQQGMQAHSMRLDIHTKNIANLDTPNYVRKIPILVAKDDISFNGLLNNMRNQTFKTGALPFDSGGVEMTGVAFDSSQGELIYKPGHPDADKNGYVRQSNVDPMVEMADAMMASRAYEANLAVAGIVKAMAQRATEIGK